MAKILNSVLIGLFAFFGFLAAFGLWGMRGADGGGTPVPHTELTAVNAAWASGGGNPIDVVLTVQNTGPDARATSVTYETEVDGIGFDSGTADLGDDMPSHKETDLRFTTELGSGFAARWLKAHEKAGESSTMVVRGTLNVDESTGVRALPFEWTSTWRGDLSHLFSSLGDCPQSAQSVCLEDAATDWKGDGLRTVLRLQNTGLQDLRVSGGTVTLVMDGITVGTADVQGGLLRGASTTEFGASMRLDEAALAQWWTAHVAQCESSTAQVTVRLSLQDDYGYDAGTGVWQTPTTPYQTAFLCNGGP